LEESIFSLVISLKLSAEKGMPRDGDWNSLAQAMANSLEPISSRLIHLKIFVSLRFDSDLILWLSTRDSGAIPEAKRLLLATGKIERFEHHFLSFYEDSPYTKGGESLDQILQKRALKYIVAYPMTKANDWYLLPYDVRKRIMAEHIGMAVSHKENKGIRSYTTYSFGISDQEFVVIYEMDNLSAWSHVTAKLREAEARKWIELETPVLVGIRI
jgi:chlorite dismutase